MRPDRTNRMCQSRRLGCGCFGHDGPYAGYNLVRRFSCREVCEYGREDLTGQFDRPRSEVRELGRLRCPAEWIVADNAVGKGLYCINEVRESVRCGVGGQVRIELGQCPRITQCDHRLSDLT